MRQLSCFFVRAIKDMRKISKTIWLIVLILLSFLFPDDDGFIASQAEAAGKIPHIVGANDQSFFFVQNSLEIQSRGQLLPGKTYPVQAPGTTTHAITVADFNKDGHPDAAVCNRNGGTVDVFLRVADPLLPYDFVDTQIPIPGAGQFHAIGSGDFDQDGLADLVVVSAGGPVYAYKNTAPNIGKSFTAFAGNYTAGGYPHDVVVADFDKDGKLDFAVANAGAGVPVFVFYGNGDGSFVPEEINVTLPGGHPENIFVGDFNVDGLPDLGIDSSVNGGANHSSLVLLINEKGGFLSTNAIAIDLGETGYITAMTVGDFFADQWQIPDFAVSLDEGDNARLVMVEAWNFPDPKAANPLDSFTVNPARSWFLDILVQQLFPSLTPWDFKSADFNNDGNVDLSLSYWDRNNESGVMILQGDGRGNLSYLSQSSTGTNRAGSYQSMHEVYWDDDLSNAKCSDFVNADAFCNDGIPCTQDVCSQGQCMHNPDDSLCSGLNNECRTGYCDLSLGCQGQPANEGNLCEVGSFCNLNATCQNGLCVGTPRDCDDGIECTEDRCDEQLDQCVHTRRNNLCPNSDNTCLNVTCDPRNAKADQVTGCVETVKANGSSCNDFLICNVNETCQDGQCGGGVPRDCSNLNTFCGTYICDEALGRCFPQPQNEGLPCEKSDFDKTPIFCEVDTVCTQGSCQGVPNDCSDGIDCTVDLCVEWRNVCLHETDDSLCPGGDGKCSLSLCIGDRGCIIDNLPDGAWCSTGDICMPEGICQKNACIPNKQKCDDGVECTKNICNAVTQACSYDTSACTSQCSDGKDNDGDGLIDANDPGCIGSWDDELSSEFACDDGIDNDGNNLKDKNDPRCQVIGDDDEMIRWISDPLTSPPSYKFHTPALGNFDGDPEFEFVVARQLAPNGPGNEDDVFIFDSNGDLLKGFTINPEGRAVGLGEPIVSDIDNNGLDDILIMTTWFPRRVFVIKDGGSINKIFEDPKLSGGFTPAIGNLDLQGNKEIVINNRDTLIAIDSNGNELWRVNSDLNRTYREYYVDGPILADIRKGNELEILMLTNFGVLVYDSHGNIIGKYYRSDQSVPPQQAAVGDMDNDQNLDAVIGYTDGVYTVTWDGGQDNHLRKSWEHKFFPVPDRGMGVITNRIFTNETLFISLGDITGDGKLDVVASGGKPTQGGNTTAYVYGISNDGHKLWEWNFENTKTLRIQALQATLVNINEDQRMEILVGADRDPYPLDIGEEAYFFILNGDGQLLDTFQDKIVKNTSNRINSYSSPIIGFLGDMDRPGIILSTRHRLVDPTIVGPFDRGYVYRLDHLKLKNHIPYPLWRMERHDPYRTSRTNACAEDKDCYDGLVETIDKCINYTCQYTLGIPFKRGDVDGNGKVDISDPIGLLKHLFLGGAEPPCKEAANAEDDDKLDITDAIVILQHLFLGKGPLKEPFDHCGIDPPGQGWNLGCASYPASSCGP